MMQYVGGEDVDLFEAANVWWMFSILAVKKIMKLSRCVTVSKWGGRASGGFRKLLMVENRTLVFPSAVLIKVE